MSDNNQNSGIRTPQNIGDIADSKLREVYEYWQTKAADGTLPRPEDIDITDYPEEAKLWALADVIDGGDDFRFRFVGTEIVALIELEPTGSAYNKLKEEYPEGGFGTAIFDIYRSVLATGAPKINGPTRMPLPNKEYLQFTSLSLPLSRDGKEIDQILTAVSVISGP